MTNVVVTGADGFIGRNLMVALRRRHDIVVTGLDIGDADERLAAAMREADVVFHLAGVNRPKDPREFSKGNLGFTAAICSIMSAAGVRPTVVFSSSTQAELGNAYGVSKLAAEEELAAWSAGQRGAMGGPVAVFRLPNVFGKWGKPDYNSVAATFCHNIAHDLPVRVDDADASIRLVHVGDVVSAFLAVLDETVDGVEQRHVEPVADTTVGELADTIRAFHASRHSPDVPELSSHYQRALYSTYLSYLEPCELAFPLSLREDERGLLAEVLRQREAGQVFFSWTHPGVTRGNHYHDTKVERFMVLAGRGLIRIRPLNDRDVREYVVDAVVPTVVVIPPGATHSIENIGDEDMLALFWADEVFDPERPDTFFESVLDAPSCAGSDSA